VSSVHFESRPAHPEPARAATAFDASRKYPLLVFPHGGPHDMIKDMFFFRWNYHLLTSRDMCC